MSIWGNTKVFYWTISILPTTTTTQRATHKMILISLSIKINIVYINWISDSINDQPPCVSSYTIAVEMRTRFFCCIPLNQIFLPRIAFSWYTLEHTVTNRLVSVPFESITFKVFPEISRISPESVTSSSSQHGGSEISPCNGLPYIASQSSLKIFVVSRCTGNVKVVSRLVKVFSPSTSLTRAFKRSMSALMMLFSSIWMGWS